MSKKVKNLIKQKPIDSIESKKYYKAFDGDHFNKCHFTSLLNYHKKDLDMSWGTLWLWDLGAKWNKGYKPIHFSHSWNLDDNDDVYDDLLSIETNIKEVNELGEFHFKTDVRNTEYKYVDGRRFGKPHPLKDNRGFMHRIGEQLGKWYKSSNPLKTPPIVYVSESAWWQDEITGCVYPINETKMETQYQLLENNLLKLNDSSEGINEYIEELVNEEGWSVCA